jgi:hypothetical protein
VGGGFVEILNDGGAENCLATSGDAIKPQKGIWTYFLFHKGLGLEEPES